MSWLTDGSPKPQVQTRHPFTKGDHAHYEWLRGLLAPRRLARLRVWLGLARAAWDVAGELARGRCACPGCGVEPVKVGDDFNAGLCTKCIYDPICVREALRATRGPRP